MHPDLSSHLHTEECNVMIRQLQQCHKENKFKKFLGACNDLDFKMGDCLAKERRQKQMANLEKSRARQLRTKQNDSTTSS